jgi:hypothetical protein
VKVFSPGIMIQGIVKFGPGFNSDYVRFQHSERNGANIESPFLIYQFLLCGEHCFKVADSARTLTPAK